MTSTARIATPDIARALALSGVVAMNYHAYLNRSEAIRPINPSVWQENNYQKEQLPRMY